MENCVIHYFDGIGIAACVWRMESKIPYYFWKFSKTPPTPGHLQYKTSAHCIHAYGIDTKQHFEREDILWKPKFNPRRETTLTVQHLDYSLSHLGAVSLELNLSFQNHHPVVIAVFEVPNNISNFSSTKVPAQLLCGHPGIIPHIYHVGEEVQKSLQNILETHYGCCMYYTVPLIRQQTGIGTGIEKHRDDVNVSADNCIMKLSPTASSLSA